MLDKTESAIAFFLEEGWSEYLVIDGKNPDFSDAGFIWPSSVAVAGNGNIYIADEFSHKLLQFNSQGVFARSIGQKGKDNIEFMYPSSIRICPKGNLFVADMWNHRVQVLDKEGLLIEIIGPEISDAEVFSEPKSLEIIDNHLFVLDENNAKIYRFDLDSFKLTGIFGGRGFSRKHFESESFKSGFVFRNWAGSAHRFSTIETKFYNDGYRTADFEFPRMISSCCKSLLIADPVSSNIIKTDTNGKIMKVWNSPEENGFCPQGVCFIENEVFTFNAQGTVARLSSDLSRNEPLSARGFKITGINTLGPDRLAVLDGWNQKVYFLRK